VTGSPGYVTYPISSSVLRCFVAAANVIRTVHAASREPVAPTLFRRLLWPGSGAAASVAHLRFNSEENRWYGSARGIEGRLESRYCIELLRGRLLLRLPLPLPATNGSIAMPVIPKTTMLRPASVKPKWYVLDADGLIVGRLATKIATVLMGKHKASYTPHVDTGDYVIVVNAERVRFSGSEVAHPEHPYLTTKMVRKTYERYSGWPGGRRVLSGIQMWQRHPDAILREAVRRMLPKNRLGRRMLNKLKLYCSPDHPHQAQQPEPMPEHLLPQRLANS